MKPSLNEKLRLAGSLFGSRPAAPQLPVSAASDGMGPTLASISERLQVVEADIADMRESKVLWSGAAYMGSGHTATLTEAISAQKNGVILVWSWYNGSEAENMNFIMTPIPKHFPSAHSSCGINCSGLSTDGHMWKYVYVYDTKLTGYSGNTTTNSGGGVTMTSDKYVLRYVIGY